MNGTQENFLDEHFFRSHRRHHRRRVVYWKLFTNWTCLSNSYTHTHNHVRRTHARTPLKQQKIGFFFCRRDRIKFFCNATKLCDESSEKSLPFDSRRRRHRNARNLNGEQTCGKMNANCFHLFNLISIFIICSASRPFLCCLIVALQHFENDASNDHHSMICNFIFDFFFSVFCWQEPQIDNIIEMETANSSGYEQFKIGKRYFLSALD